jgi:hypothetical protein
MEPAEHNILWVYSPFFELANVCTIGRIGSVDGLLMHMLPIWSGDYSLLSKTVQARESRISVQCIAGDVGHAMPMAERNGEIWENSLCYHIH